MLNTRSSDTVLSLKRGNFLLWDILKLRRRKIEKLYIF
jgi:hypothetical protein